MEELTKTQIVLLTLMVSFVTSIATGIITVALMDQAPAGVTQTFNRVVERTIERVVPEKGQGAGVITKEVVIKEENLITDSIEKNSRSLVRIDKSGIAEDGNPLVYFASYGMIVSKDGLIAADKANMSAGAAYRGLFPDGKTFDLELVWNEPKSSIALFRAKLPEKEKDYVFNEIKFGDSDALKLGQTVISLQGRDKTAVSIGIVSALVRAEASESNPNQTVTSISTNLGAISEVYGNPGLNIFGEVIGFRTSGESGSYFIPSNSVKEDIAAYLSGLNPAAN